MHMLTITNSRSAPFCKK